MERNNKKIKILLVLIPALAGIIIALINYFGDSKKKEQKVDQNANTITNIQLGDSSRQENTSIIGNNNQVQK